MPQTKPRIVYLSSNEKGQELLSWLSTQPCDVVFSETNNRRITEFPQYDLGLSFLYTHRIPASEFANPMKWINFHPGPLPEFRGRNIAYHAIIGGASHFGATIHYMDVEFDSGEIIAVDRFPIEPHHTAGDLVRLSHQSLVSLFKEYVPLLLQHGKLPSRPQGEGAYFRKTPIDDIIELTDKQSRLIRALTVIPHFYATITIAGQRYKVVPEIELPWGN